MRARFKSDFLRVLNERGFLHRVSSPERLDALPGDSSIAGYYGVDPTAPSMHAGAQADGAARTA